LLTSIGAEGIADLLKEHAEHVAGPLVGVGRDAELEEAEILVDVARELYGEAKTFVEGKTTPIRKGRFMSSGVAGTIKWNLEHFDRIAENVRPAAKANEPLPSVAGTLNQLAEGFRDLAGRLAASCVIEKNLL